MRVNGENWSAVALNGIVRAGSPVEVLRVAGVRLEVWGDAAVGPSKRPRSTSPSHDGGAHGR